MSSTGAKLGAALKLLLERESTTYRPAAQQRLERIRETTTYRWLERRYGGAVALQMLDVFINEYKADGREL